MCLLILRLRFKLAPRKPFPSDIPQAGYEHFLADGGAESLGGIGSARGKSHGAPWPDGV